MIRDRIETVVFVALALAALLLGGCGGESDTAPTPSPTTEQPTATATVPAEESPTPTPTVMSSPTAAPTVRGVPMFRGNLANAGVNPGPGRVDHHHLRAHVAHRAAVQRLPGLTLDELAVGDFVQSRIADRVGDGVRVRLDAEDLPELVRQQDGDGPGAAETAQALRDLHRRDLSDVVGLATASHSEPNDLKDFWVDPAQYSLLRTWILQSHSREL